MLRNASHHLFPAVKQVIESQALISRSHARFAVTNIYQFSIGRKNHLNLLRTVTTNRFLQQRKRLQNPHSHYHDPFTITRMTSGSVFQASIERTPVPLWAFPDNIYKECHVRLYSTKPPNVPLTPLDENHNEAKTAASSTESVGKTKAQVGSVIEEDRKEKISLVKKFKLMYKQYWYVLIPVHIVTSIVWYGSFFIAAKSGVDIVPIMEKLGAGEKILTHLQSSNAGYYAIAYAMYKIATPARYTVTIGGTTLSINYLRKRGYIKPVPSSEKLKEMYEGKKEELIEKKEELVERYQEKKGEIVDRYQERKEEMVEIYQEKKNEVVQKVSDKRDEFREKVEEKKEEFKDKIEERKEKLDNFRSRRRKQG